MVWAPRDLGTLISDPKEALDVFDFEPVARKNLPPAHFGYMVTGIDDEVTLRANREGFLKFQLRPRRLVDVSMIDMTVEIFGAKYDNPIVIAPTGSNRAFTRTEKWQSPTRQKLAIPCRFSLAERQHRSKTQLQHAAPPCGSRSMPGSGKRQSAAGSLCLWTVASVAAQISSRPWPWARKRCASDGPIFGASAPSVSWASHGGARFLTEDFEDALDDLRQDLDRRTTAVDDPPAMI